MRRYYAFSFIIWLLGIVVSSTIKINEVLNYGAHIRPTGSADNVMQLGFSAIILNNIVMITILHFGFISMGLLTFATLAYNGFVVGYVFRIAFGILPLGKICLSTLPHSIELVATIYSGGYGFSQSVELYKALKKDSLNFSNILFRNIKPYLLSIAVIIVAAFIEVNISMKL